MSRTFQIQRKNKKKKSSPSLQKVQQHSVTKNFSNSTSISIFQQKNRHLLETVRALLFQMHVPKHFWANVVSKACFLINWMPSSVLNWDTPYHILFPNKPLFPIEPHIFGCTCFVRDVRPQVSKLDHKSLKCIFLGYSRVHKGYRCYCSSLRRYLFLRMSSFLRMSLSLHSRPTLVKGRQMTC